MATQLDVAKRAGVSFITVSRVINNRPNVKEETRKKVLEAIEELKYYPNSLGRGLNMNRVNTIGIVSPVTETQTLHATAYYNELMIGIEKYSQEMNYDILISTHDAYSIKRDILRLFFERKADGLILLTPDLKSPQIEDIEKMNIPCVIVGDRPLTHDVSFVDSDNRAGMFKATEYAIKKGHKRLAFVQGFENSRNAIDRFAGFIEALRVYNITIPDEWIFQGNFDYDSGRVALARLFSPQSKDSQRPTVLICANDLMALGALAESKSLGLKVPNDIALVGFDGIETASIVHPSITTMKQPLIEMGYAAANILFQKIENPAVQNEKQIFPVELLPGESC